MQIDSIATLTIAAIYAIGSRELEADLPRLPGQRFLKFHDSYAWAAPEVSGEYHSNVRLFGYLQPEYKVRADCGRALRIASARTHCLPSIETAFEIIDTEGERHTFKPGDSLIIIKEQE